MPGHLQPSTYRAPRWLPGGHAQTLYAALWARVPHIPYRRERWILPDGDFLDLDWVDGSPGAPLVVLFHGLEGNSRGHYARALMQAVRRRGWRGVVPHFRGCSGEPNRLARAYHSGDSAEIDLILRRFRAEFPGRALFAVGVSLGGNALLKWLGQWGAECLSILHAAAAVSAPMDLVAAGRALDRGFNRHTYVRHFLSTLRPKALEKIARHRLPVSPQAIRAAATLYRFDDLFTAPLHGFRDAMDYWRRASSKPWLNSISVPTLILNAQNDPFLPASALPTPEQVSAAVTLEFPAAGGHAGFVAGPFPGNLDWLPQRLIDYFAAHLAQPTLAPLPPNRHNAPASCAV
ncbi:hydrolase [Thiobacter aerophilum]|uniref:Hydrolase n=1 Tax=Thiobacter aerophilum TaxID=3121275 RepID=A0ABV0EBZ8_9BURK